MVVTQEQQLNNVMQSGLSWNVGSGDKIKFWEDCWNGEGVALMQKFPRLYQISRQQHNLIQQVESFSNTSWEWNLTWRRQLFDNEADSAYEFIRELSQLGKPGSQRYMGNQDRRGKDKWREDDLTLEDKYPILYQVSTQQNYSIDLTLQLLCFYPM
ncbi:hypothetical protein HKD37_11G032008 [Glycine soja]